MAVAAKIDGTEYQVRTISGTQANVFTNFDETPPQVLLDMIGDGVTHELIAVKDGVERERWVVVCGGCHTEYTPEEVVGFVSWNVMTHNVIEAVDPTDPVVKA